jgi:hypothetical protein
LNLDTHGSISGTPTTTGTYTVSFSATGIFDRTISNISLTGTFILLTSWAQTATSVVISPVRLLNGANSSQATHIGKI